MHGVSKPRMMMSLAKRERPYYGVGGGVWVGIAEALHVAELQFNPRGQAAVKDLMLSCKGTLNLYKKQKPAPSECRARWLPA